MKRSVVSGHLEKRFCVGLGLMLMGLFSVLYDPVSAGPTDYPHAYKTLMEAYRVRLQYLTTRPLPPKSAPKEQKRAAVAKQGDAIATAFTDCANKLNALKPPAVFQEVHAATLAMLKTNAADNHHWAEVVLHGDRQTRTRVLKENEARELKVLVRMQQALQRIGGTSKELQSVIGEMKQSTKTP